MTRRSMSLGHRRLLKIIEEMEFGRIEQLYIQHGEPCFERPPRVVQEIKLGSESDCQTRQPDGRNDDVVLKKEFARLFTQLNRLCNATVDIEIRHYLPFKLALERSKDLVA